MKQIKRNLAALILWWINNITSREPISLALRNLSFDMIKKWSNFKQIKLLHLSMDFIFAYNVNINMVFQNSKKDNWIGDILDQPKVFKTKLDYLSVNSGACEQDFDANWDEQNKRHTIRDMLN